MIQKAIPAFLVFLLAACASNDPFPVQPAPAPDWTSPQAGANRAENPENANTAESAQPQEEVQFELLVRQVSGELQSFDSEFPLFFRLYWTQRVLEDAGLLGEMVAAEIVTLADELFGSIPQRISEGAYKELQLSPFDLNGTALRLQLQQYSLPAGIGRLEPSPNRLLYVVTNLPPGEGPQPKTTVAETAGAAERRYYSILTFADRPPMDLLWWIGLEPRERGETLEADWTTLLGPFRSVLSSPVDVLPAPVPESILDGSEEALIAAYYFLRIGALGTARDMLDSLPPGQLLFFGSLLECLEYAAPEE